MDPAPEMRPSRLFGRSFAKVCFLVWMLAVMFVFALANGYIRAPRNTRADAWLLEAKQRLGKFFSPPTLVKPPSPLE